MRLTSESVFLKAQGPVGARKERRIISRDSYVGGGGILPGVFASNHLILRPIT